MERSEAIRIITLKCREMGIHKVEQIQYVIATVEHETAGTFKPVEEAYYIPNAEAYRRRKLKYYPYYGRGFVQLTHKYNYEKFSKIMNIDLVGNPALALEFDNSLFILIYGMIKGTFTGKKLDDYFNKAGSNFVKARKIINGTDKAKKIAILAQNIRVDYFDEVL
ncbi:Carboxypeptidase [hydrothermal vent metagenome]|uniref:Carboxypeptidase n=1 Tax=hydrothermal vent metagenome TaxID=652676 RepID=A0A1W1CCN9_9ZZZZ